jgi:hypothetical protein
MSIVRQGRLRQAADGGRLCAEGNRLYATDFKDSGSKPVAKAEAAAPACGTGACPASN